MSYANQPRVYYDYGTSELKIDVLRDQSSESDAINYGQKTFFTKMEPFCN